MTVRVAARCLGVFGLWGLACLLGSCRGIEAVSRSIHVSPEGDDKAVGTAAAPFRSIRRAQAEARRRIAGGLSNPLVVMLGSGTYELAEPLEFTAADSGTETCPVTYRAAPGGAVRISGGRRVSGWRGGREAWYRVKLPQVAAGQWFFRNLTVGGRRAVRARWPETDGELRIATVEKNVTAFTFDRPLPPGTFALEHAELVVQENWSITRGRIVGVQEGRLRTETPMGWIGHGPATTASSGKPAYLEHALEFLDRPGEWFLDSEPGLLFYIPREGEDPSRHTEVVAPVLQQLVRIAGTRKDPVRHLRFENLAFEHTDFPLPEFGYNEIQAAHYGTTLRAKTYVQPVAVECVFAEDCRFDSCRVAHTGASGIGFGPGCRRNAVVGCTIEDIGGTGIMVGWRGAGELGGGREGQLDADWANPVDAPTGNRITDCRIRRCGADSGGAVGVFVAFSADTLVAHNLVHDLPYTGISVGYRWNRSKTTQARCVVEANHIHDVMQELADGGGIYTLGSQPGTVFRENHIHDVHRSAFAHGGAPNNGFFVDQGSSGFRFERNVVHATAGGSVRFNQCKREWHEWRGNFFGSEPASTAAAREIAARAGPRAR